ncbi:MAG: CoA pyrophosphatase [Gammaproteobacteria bacterium]|uniref:CoA pyrophosphatase n=1 Tax=Nevskia sp. TaxID=1929292 RepID=UPI004035F071|nr:CoA pyrophosphatase [Gammaproteobacteria bacterium]
MHHDDALARLRLRLAGSSELQRPVARVELPLKLGHLVTESAVSLLKPAAVLVPILRRPHGHTVLLTRRADHLRQHKGQISFPGGRRDQTDSSYAFAALREAQEEVGLPPEAVQVLGYLDDHPTLTGYRITPVVGYIDSPFSPITDPGEVAEAFELPLGHVADDDCFQRKVLSRGGFDVPFLEIQYAGHQIWGATAAILWNLREQLLAA